MKLAKIQTNPNFCTCIGGIRINKMWLESNPHLECVQSFMLPNQIILKNGQIVSELNHPNAVSVQGAEA